ncbi:MAG: hypothetical protein ACRD4O_17620 [Bryobacteraceae bacterium]
MRRQRGLPLSATCMLAPPNVYIFSIATLASAGAAISTLEWIAGRRQLQDDGLFSWMVIGTRPSAVGTGPFAGSLNYLLSFHPFLSLLILRLVALMLLPVSLWFGRGALLMLSIVVLSSLLMHFRSPWGMDGSDQMLTQVFGALFLCTAAGSLLAAQAALWFIAGQACLSYATAGIAKARSAYWHDGKAVFAIFNTRTYGYEPIARFLLARPRTTKTLTWAAVVMESAFCLALIAGYPGCLLFIAWGVAFHLMNAAVMGLNSFFWSFIATYPAVIYCSIAVAHFLRWN